MTTTPDSFSMDDLSAMLTGAPKEDDCHASNDDKLTQEFIGKTVEEALDMMTDRCPDPVVHKLAMQLICARLMEWHTVIGNKRAEDQRCSTAWLRDAGKFQAISCILHSISLGENDHWCEQAES